MKKTFTSKLQKLDSQVWYMAVRVPDEIGDAFAKKDIKRLVVTFNDSIKNHVAFMPVTEPGHYIMINKEIRKKLKLEEGDEVKVHLEPDTSKYGFPVPPEMEELLLQDPLAERVFESLTDGKKRSLLYMVGKPKGSATRLKKAVAITEYLKLTKGKLDYKELNEFVKNFSI